VASQSRQIIDCADCSNQAGVAKRYACLIFRLALAAFLACALAFVALAAPSKAYASLGQTEGWGAAGSYDTTWYKSGQTYFEISNARQLAGLAHLVNISKVSFSGCTIKLTSDIDLSGKNWAPIGTVYSNFSSSFSGTFDGDGHTISGLTINSSYDYQALFGYVESALIEKLVVRGSVTGQSCVAGIVAYSTDSSFVKLANYCTVTATGSGTSTGEVYFGSAAGVVCYAATTNSTAEQYFQDLYNYGLINAGDKNSGGVIGFLYSNGNVNVSHCANYNNVNVGSAHNMNGEEDGVGGVIGATAGYGTYKVSECVNTGTITTANAVTTGGIVGSLGGQDSSVNFCRNTGTINGAEYAGGIAGNVRATDGQVVSCYNTGKVNAATSSGSGGIVASQTGSNLDIRNNVYLSGTAGTADAEGSATAISKSDLQSQATVDMLNLGGTSFVKNNSGDGYPELSWEPSALDGGGTNQQETDDDDDDTYAGESVFEDASSMTGDEQSDGLSQIVTAAGSASAQSANATENGGSTQASDAAGDAAAEVSADISQDLSSADAGDIAEGSEASFKLVELSAAMESQEEESAWMPEEDNSQAILLFCLFAFLLLWGVSREYRFFSFECAKPFGDSSLLHKIKKFNPRDIFKFGNSQQASFTNRL
jgi:hypothetical protein